MDKKRRCYIYTRVSTEMQTEGFSLDAQRDKILGYAQYQDIQVVEEFCDAGRSGKNVTGRPEFQHMMAKIQSGKDPVDFVLVFKLSRFGRNAADVLSNLQTMQDYGTNLICVDDNIDSSKDSGKLMIAVLSAVAEIERENILIQSMAGRRQKAREGRWNGGESSGMGNLSNGGGMGGSSSGIDSYDAVVTYTEDGTYSDMDYTSTGSDENAVLVTSGDITISDSTISRISSDSTGGDNSSFYGVGASALVTSGTLRITNTTITSDSAGGAGVFAYGDGIAYVSDTTITTEQDTSGGIHVAGGGTLYAWNLTVNTSGESSAAIRSDRGSGTMVVDGGTYVSNGTGSPAVYSTADITVANATLTANSSEAICIEGLNTIRLFDCDLSGSMRDSSQNDCTWNVIVYQSMSGDSEVGNGSFYMIGGTLTANNGGMFYTTNTESTFLISDVDITYAEDSEFFLKCTGNSNQRGWGSTGSNGADCSFTAIDQEMKGAVIYDSISNLDFYMLEGSVMTGYFVDDESNAGNGGNGECNVYIDSTSTWVVTNYSTVTNLYCEGTIVDEEGNSVTILSSDGTVYATGDSTYTITVESYSTTVDTTDASSLISFDDYSVENPF